MMPRRSLDRLRQTEIDLLLERIHLANVDVNAIAEPNNAASTTADELRSVRIELEEIFLHAGQMHQAAHRQIGHIHKKTEVAHVDHQRRVAFRLAGLELRGQVRE